MDTGQILVENYSKFLALAQAIVRNEEDAKDIVQDAVLVVLEKQSFIQDPLLYCFRLVRNMSFRCLRSPKYSPGYDFPEIPVINPEEQDILAEIRKAEQELPEVLQRVIVLRYDRNLSVQAIAKRVHVSVSTVKRHLSEAKKFLKARITLDSYY